MKRFFIQKFKMQSTKTFATISPLLAQVRHKLKLPMGQLTQLMLSVKHQKGDRGRCFLGVDFE